MVKDQNENNHSGKNMVRGYIKITGRVQGVAFRYYARSMASRLGVKGWIRNVINGDVEVMIEGNKESVTRMIEWCKEGPRMAYVEDLTVSWLPYTGEFLDFNIK
jgi:acylphosphatase